ncbi:MULTISPECIES: hypothetical protein [unclassified Listeria]|uniref:hypothetical protein n=1 Tax=unclassified Listeria TaxID=2642072 RepID=UPI000B589E4A|nr:MULTISPECIES: hypothetical protein [unclassified Listeria]
MKKPIHKRWWFWALIIVLGLGLIGSCSNDDTVAKEDYQKLEAKIKAQDKKIDALNDDLSAAEDQLSSVESEKEEIQEKLSVYEKEEIEKAENEANKLLDSAEKSLNTADLDKAKKFIDNNEFLTVSKFSDRIDAVQLKIEQKAEAAKKKADEAKKRAEENPTVPKKETNQTDDNNQAPNTQPKQAAPTPKASETVATVFVAPQSGKKFHYDSSCRGLNSANSVVSMSKSEAIASGYSLCGWED